MGRSTLAAVISGDGGLRWATVAAFIEACTSYAAVRNRPLPSGEVDMLVWRTRYDKAYPHPGRRTNRPPVGEAQPSAYLEQVRRIAPEELYDRERELTELAAFCTEPERGPYVWWRARAWAGKSALMSWFVLHPPPGVRVVSFFVTARYHGQSDRVAFIDNVLEQLATLLDRPIPRVTDATRDTHLLSLLTAAAQDCRERGERLVLVVDGLDEDRGVTVGSDAHSIAALLPARLVHGLRVIVAGRPDPPIPDDVLDWHPLRDPAIVRVLAPSPHAAVVRVDAERELKRLLHGNQTEQDLLGLVAAACGGLSGPDLAELLTSRLSVGDIEEHLRSASGRTFTRRVGHWRLATGPEMYTLGHEELQNTAVGFLAKHGRLDGYRQRLHIWNDHYRDQHWPADTPEYLLRSYYQLLRDTGDLPGMIACATDDARHDRMLDITAGDAVALAEINTAQEYILGHDNPDLLSMIRLAVHLDRIEGRNAHIPKELPVVWAAVGQPIRAEALARSTASHVQAQALAAVATSVAATNPDHAEDLAVAINSQYWQVQALAGVASATIRSDADRAIRLADQAAALAYDITDPKLQLQALTVVAAVHRDRAAELADQAEALTHSLSSSYEQSLAVAALAKAVAAAGDRDRAMELTDRAEALTWTITNPYRTSSSTSPYWQSLAVTALAKAVAAVGDRDRAMELTDRAEALTWTVTNPYEQVYALATLVGVVAGAGDRDRAVELADRAEAIARSLINEPFERELALTVLADAMAAAGDCNHVDALVGAITEPREQARVLAALAKAVAAAGEHDRAAELARRAETIARAFLSDPFQQTLALATLAKAMASIGEHNRASELACRAEAQAGSITSRAERVSAAVVLVEAVAAARDYDRAGTLARAISAPDRQVEALTGLVRAVAAAGEHERAAEFVDWAETIARSVTHPVTQELALASLAEVATTVGDYDRAEAVGRSITDSTRRAEVLAVLAGARAATGDHDRALAVAGEAEGMAPSDPRPDRQSALMAALATAVAAAGDHDRALALADRAETLFRSIPDRVVPMWGSPKAVVEAIAATHDYDHAEAFACSITDPQVRAQALTTLAQVLEPRRACPFLAQAILLGGWRMPLHALAQVQPSAVVAAADEFLALIGQ